MVNKQFSLIHSRELFSNLQQKFIKQFTPFKRSIVLRLGCRSYFKSRESDSILISKRRSASQREKGVSGLFCTEDLTTAEDFSHLVQRAIKRCDEIRGWLRDVEYERGSQSQSRDILYLMDMISNEVCSVIDAAELCRQVHTSDRFRTAADAAFTDLSCFINLLNTDASLYTKLCEIRSDDKVFSSLPSHTQTFLTDLKEEYESEGIHLSLEEREKLRFLRDDIVQLESSFSQNSVADDAVFSIGPVSAKDRNFENIRRWVEQYIPQPSLSSSSAVAKDRMLVCSSNKRIASVLLRNLSCEENRREVWVKSSTQPIANADVLGGLILKRANMAQQQGFDSYASKFLKSKAAGSPENVSRLLLSVAQAVKPYADRELETLLRLKKDSGITRSRSGASESRHVASEDSHGGGSDTLHPWDIPYLQSLHASKKQQQQQERSGFANSIQASSAIADYLPVSLCVHSLGLLCHELFGIRVQSLEIDSTDDWLGSGGGCDADKMNLNGFTASLNRRGIYKLRLSKYSSSYETVGNSLGGPISASPAVKFDMLSATGKQGKEQDEETLGIVYLDLFRRENKFRGSAHFTVRCGCRERDFLFADEINNGDERSELRSTRGILNRGTSANNTIDSVDEEDSLKSFRFQVPVVTLVLNFSPPISSSVPSLLTLHELETLYHEWGHALHSVLSRTEFQHLSGTRSAVDFAEVPSHLFEYFARDAAFLSRWARRWDKTSASYTSAAPSSGLLEAALAARSDFAAIDLQTQLLYSKADQFVFGPELTGELTSLSSLSPTHSRDAFMLALEGVAKVQESVTSLPLGRGLDVSEALNSLRMGGSNANRRETRGVLPIILLCSHDHFTTYGAGYYSYIFARVYAAQLWDKHFASDPLNRQSGMLLWREMLSYGAAKAPMTILTELVDGPADASHLLNHTIKKD